MLKLDKILGQGSYGIVYKGTYNDTDIAFKRNFKDSSHGDLGVNVLKEFDALLRLKDDNVSYTTELLDVCYDFKNGEEQIQNLIKLTKNKDDIDEKIHFILELCDTNLNKHLKANKQEFKRINSLKYFMKSVLLSIAWMHANGIIHRDLKPENILVNGDEYKVCDFGMCAQNFGEKPKMPGLVTCFYRAPEICKELQYDEKIDLWSLGSILFEILSGGNIFQSIDDDSEKLLNFFYTKFPEQKKEFQTKTYEKEILYPMISNLRTYCKLTDTEIRKYKEEDPHFLNTYYEIVAKLLSDEPEFRPTAEEVLIEYYDFFQDDKLSDKLLYIKEAGKQKFAMSRNSYVNNKTNITSIMANNLNIREVRRKAFSLFDAIFKTRFKNEWYTDRVFFHSISLFDLYLLSFSGNKINLKTQFNREEHNRIMHNKFTYDEIFLRVYVILYTSLKFNEMLQIFEWKNFAPKDRYYHTFENINFVEFFEIFLFKEIKGEDNFHILNDYESLFFDNNIKPSSKIIETIFEDEARISQKIQ